MRGSGPRRGHAPGSAVRESPVLRGTMATRIKAVRRQAVLRQEPAARRAVTANAIASPRTFYCASGSRQPSLGAVSIAHEVSGLGSTRVVRFSVPKGSGDDGTGTVATGPENAEVQGRFEPLGAAGAIGNGSGGGFGGGGRGDSARPAALRSKKAPPAV